MAEFTVEVECPKCHETFETDVDIEPEFDDGWRD